MTRMLSRCLGVLVFLIASSCSTQSTPPEPSRAALEYPNDAAGWRQRRYEDEHGRIPPRAWPTALEARERTVAASALQPAAGGIARGAWVERGPGNVAGRSRTLVIDPRNPQRMFAGSVSGGLWRSTNGGTTWSLVDGWWANLSVGALTMDPSNPDTLYVGTGEGFYSLAHLVRSISHFVRGAGVLKSTDGGLTWTLLPATANWQAVTRIAVCPTNSNLLLASRRPGGIARSTDGGQTWTDVAVADTSFHVLFDPNDGTKAVAHLAPVSVQSHRVVTSTDSGLTWQPALSGLASVAGENSRIELAYARSAPGVVFASVGGGTVWRSADGGRTWTQRGSGTGTGYYYNCIWVDPTNENLVVVGALHIRRSSNGGTSFSQISNGYIMTVEPHPDVHGIFADPGYDGSSNRRVYVCTDGGLHVANDILAAASGGSGWRDLDASMISTQFYAAAGHATNDTVIGGAQDNGTQRVRGASQTSNLVFGGDGMQVQIDPTNANYVYGEYQWLSVFRSTNGGSSASSILSGISEAGSANTANFVAPLRLDPNDSLRLYGGGLSLWRTNNARASGVSWSIVKASVGSLISAIAITPGASDVVYVAHNDGRVYRTTNGTAASPTWTAMDDNGANNPLPNRVVTRLIVDPTSPATVYATLGGFAVDNLWRSTDSGVTWLTVIGTAPQALPPAPVYGMAVHPDDGDVLYAATEVGVFSSDDRGAHWSARNDGPANVVCEEITFMHGARRLVLATLGRGLWTADVARPGAQSFGTACAGHATPPTLAIDPLAQARIGEVMNVNGANLRIGQPGAFLLVGLSNSTWNGLALPADLTPIGMANCPLLVSGDLVLAASISGTGTAVWSLALPDNRSLLGGKLYAQGLASDPGLNQAGFAVSAGLELTLGW